MGLSHTLHFILNHPMNRGRPVSTLARFAKWQLQSRLQDEVMFDWIEGAKLAVRRGMTGATGNIYCGLHEYADMRFVLDSLKPGDLFVDIGANVGSYTVLASKVCGARTISVEPDPDTARALRRNIEVNEIGDRVEVVEAALGAREGTVRFTVGRDTVNRVATANDKDTREVPVRTLDDVLGGASPKIIKMDVEGFETQVLEGATRTMMNPALTAIVTEMLDDNMHGILQKAGFEKYYYVPEKKSLSDSAVFPSNNSLMLRRGAGGPA